MSNETPLCPSATRFNGKACASLTQKPFCTENVAVFSNNTCIITKASQCPNLSMLTKANAFHIRSRSARMERLLAEKNVSPLPNLSASTVSP
ncbi:hypothetical protein V8C42DRAFT_335757 [Trichoderma barbatum]